MKKLLLYTLAISTLAISCRKTDFLDNVSNGDVVEFKATIDEKADTKSNFDLDATSGTFYWTGIEEISWMYKISASPHDYFQQNVLTSKTSADSKETSLVFSGSTVENGTAYAFYPTWKTSPDRGIGWSSNNKDNSSIFAWRLYLPETIEYNETAPLKDVVPMIAEQNGSGDFVFTPVTGIIGVHVKNLPSAARKITLSSTGSSLSGWYFLTSYVDNVATNLSTVRSTGLTTEMSEGSSDVKTITFTSGLDKEEHAFYFPVSVGTLNDLTISIKGSDDSVLQTVTYGKSITTARAVISDLPLMDLAKATNLVITGTAADPFAHLEKFGPDAVSARYAVSTTEEDAKTAVTTGTAFAGSGTENKVSIAQATSGRYFIAYQVLNSSSEVIYTGSKEFYYLADTEAAGTYKFDALYCLAAFDRKAWRDLTSSTDNRLVLQISDDPTKGSLMITDYLGLEYNGTVTNKNLTNSSSNSVFGLNHVGDYLPKSYLTGTFSAGAPVYGWLNSSNNYIYFDNTANQTLFYYNSVAYTLRNGIANQPGFIFVYNKAVSPVKITYGSTTNLTLVPYNAEDNAGKFDGADSMILPSSASASNSGAIVGTKQ